MLVWCGVVFGSQIISTPPAPTTALRHCACLCLCHSLGTGDGQRKRAGAWDQWLTAAMRGQRMTARPAQATHPTRTRRESLHQPTLYPIAPPYLSLQTSHPRQSNSRLRRLLRARARLLRLTPGSAKDHCYGDFGGSWAAVEGRRCTRRSRTPDEKAMERKRKRPRCSHRPECLQTYPRRRW